MKNVFASCVPIAFALLALASFPYAEAADAPDGGSLSLLLSPLVGAKPYAVDWESSDSGNYHYLISQGGTPLAFAKLWKENGDTYGYLVSDEKEALALVQKYDSSKAPASGIPALVSSATSRMQGFTDGFDESQAECRRLMGLANRTCDSFDSCQKACYAVTSFCQEIAAQFGKPFIYDLWQYENDTKSVHSLYSQSLASAQAAGQNPSAENLIRYAQSLENLDMVSTRMVKDSIFVTERYCGTPPLSLGKIRDARLDIAKARQAFELQSSVKERAAQLASNAKKAYPAGEKISLAPNALPSQPKNSNATASQPISQNALSLPDGLGKYVLPLAIALGGAFALMLAAAGAIAYLALKKKH